jgi:L-serine dehydratase
MGPGFASEIVRKKHPEANRYLVTLYNSLALTGNGHLTDTIVKQKLDPIPVTFAYKIDMHRHPNFMTFEVYKDEVLLDTVEVRSIGGGDILFGAEERDVDDVYPEKNFEEIKAFCVAHGCSLYEYAKHYEPTSMLF